ncbi:MAG: PilZ domain-containing protein [Candidatus Firestonebacteria bacterium]
MGEKDRRLLHRVSDIVNIRYGVKGRDKQKIETIAKNISGGGAGICLAEKLAQGTILELEITIPNNPQKAIKGEGEVLWTKSFGTIKENIQLYETGLQFTEVDHLAIGKVYSYLNQGNQNDTAA